MDPRISFVTLAVPELDAARAFYADDLGWAPVLKVAGDERMIPAGEGLGDRLQPQPHRPDRAAVTHRPRTDRSTR